jgi:SSS family transporter
MIVSHTSIVAALAPADLTVVGVSIFMLLIISWYFGREEKDTHDFFLGGRKIPPIAAQLSFIATEISAITLVTFPALAYSENWRWLQFFIGQILARIAVAWLFIPAYYNFNCTSIYQFLRHRFGAGTQYAGSAFFLFTRLLGSGIRLYAASMAVAVILQWSLSVTLMLFTVVSILFIAFGGIKAVIWAGAYQAMFFLAAGIVLIAYLLGQIDGGFRTAFDTAQAAGKMSIFNFHFKWSDHTTFLTGVTHGMFAAMAAFGADQEMVQRLLTVRTSKASQRTILSTIITVLPAYWIYLIVGTLLFVFYKLNPSAPQPTEAKTVLSHFVLTSLPFGLKGFILAAIILANIDSPLSSLTSSFVTDLYRPLIRRNASERHYLLVSRIGVVIFGLILVGIAFACEPVENLAWKAFEIVSLSSCALLGVFLFGLLSRRRANRTNIIAMVIGSLTATTFWILIQKDIISMAWTWLIVIGTGVTFLIALLLSREPLAEQK